MSKREFDGIIQPSDSHGKLLLMRARQGEKEREKRKRERKDNIMTQIKLTSEQPWKTVFNDSKAGREDGYVVKNKREKEREKRDNEREREKRRI